MIAELQPGDPDQLGGYRLLGRLGSGGMGQVFLGQAAAGQLVAVKAVRPDLAGNREFRARFRQEVAAAQRVISPRTVQMVDADLAGPVPWLATAYIGGPSLADAVLEHGPLPVASVLLLAAGLAAALQATHAAGVVHRDLKPANVLLAGDGPRLIDFGVSRAAEASPLTQSGLVLGSPGFLSPEQAEGASVGPASDIFSLGAVLTFAATGEGPFGTGSSAALLYRAVYGKPYLGRVPAPLQPLIERCLAKDPRCRPTAGELVEDLGPGQPAAAGWLPAPVAASLCHYQAADATAVPVRAAMVIPPGGGPVAPVAPGATPATVVRAGRSPATVVRAGLSPAAVVRLLPGNRESQAGRQGRARRRPLDVAWLAVTSGLAAAAIAVIMVPGPPGKGIRLQTVPQVSGSTQPPGGGSPQADAPALRHPPAGTVQTAAPSGPGPSPAPVAVIAAQPASQPVTQTLHTGQPTPSSSPPASHQPPKPLPVPSDVTATPTGPSAIRVSWTAPLDRVAGFRIAGGCADGACPAGAPSLTERTGRATWAVFAVTPGTSECFRVRSADGSRVSRWSAAACTTTPGLVIPAASAGQWTGTGVSAATGDKFGIAAAGQLTVSGGPAVNPAGDTACKPSTAYPGEAFPAPDLPCWSLIGRYGAGRVFEVGTGTLAAAAAPGPLSLAVNAPAGAVVAGGFTVSILRGVIPPPPAVSP